MQKLLLIPVSGSLRFVEAADDQILEECQKAVRGYVERIALTDNHCLLVNDEAGINDMTFNRVATELAGKWLFGPAVLVATEIHDGVEYLAGLSKGFAQIAMDILSRIATKPTKK